jgi:hypothetical protein
MEEIRVPILYYFLPMSSVIEFQLILFGFALFNEVYSQLHYLNFRNLLKLKMILLFRSEREMRKIIEILRLSCRHKIGLYDT